MIKEKEDMVYRLHKALYGLKHAPRAWNKKIDSYLVEIGLPKCKSEYDVYVQAVASDITLICLYVDDLLVTCKSEYDVLVTYSFTIHHKNSLHHLYFQLVHNVLNSLSLISVCKIGSCTNRNHYFKFCI